MIMGLRKMMILCYNILLLLTISSGFRVRHAQYNNNIMKNTANKMSDRKDEELARANKISFLLNNAVQMIKFKSSNSTSKTLRPLDMSFSSTHRIKIQMNDSMAAQRYLSLPTSNYSLLNSNVISRSDDDDTFEMTLPLGDLTSVTGMTISAILKTSIKVIPDTENGKLTFQSGPFYFLPSLKKDINNVNNINNVTTESDIQKGLPEWLIWGGSQGNSYSYHSILLLILTYRRDRRGKIINSSRL